jgi:hypothetical protein
MGAQFALVATPGVERKLARTEWARPMKCGITVSGSRLRRNSAGAESLMLNLRHWCRLLSIRHSVRDERRLLC